MAEGDPVSSDRPGFATPAIPDARLSSAVIGLGAQPGSITLLLDVALSSCFVVRYIRGEIHDAAHRHGVDDDDIRHAMTHAMVVEDQDDDTRLYLGPSKNAALLEVIAIVRGDGSEMVIHAMRMRAKYQRLLPGD